VRIIPALILGTAMSFAATVILAWGNGAPVPSGWHAMLQYPTGNAWQYFLMVWFFYVISLVITAKKR
jgi:hypothetical protein